MEHLTTKVLQSNESTNSEPCPRVRAEDLLDTLAQLRTDPLVKSLETLTRRAKAKFLTNGIIFPLIDLKSDLEKSYRKTYYCTSILMQEGHKITSKYCNNRWCIVCSRIMTAKRIKKYYPIIRSEIQDMQFVTLTDVNVKGPKLQKEISDMIKDFQRIKDKMRNRDHVKIKGIRKLEVTYNPQLNSYNPHFHSIMEGKDQAEQILHEWMIRHPMASIDAQKVKPADHNSLIELLKYTAKLVNKNDYTKLDDGRIQLRIHAKALDTIFKALYRKRTFQGFGISLNLDEDVSELKSEVYEEITSDIDVWKWDQDNSDWISTYGELLTGCDAHKIYQVIQAVNK